MRQKAIDQLTEIFRSTTGREPSGIADFVDSLLAAANESVNDEIYEEFAVEAVPMDIVQIPVDPIAPVSDPEDVAPIEENAIYE